MASTQPIVIGFDGSEAAARAIGTAAEMFPGARAVVVHVWHMPNLYTAGYAGAPALAPDAQEEVDRAAGDQAAELLERGKGLAQRAGLEVEGSAYVTSSPVWRQLLEAAEQAHARVIVVGSRGRGEITSLVLGSTSQALAHHSRIPLLIVPPEADS